MPILNIDDYKIPVPEPPVDTSEILFYKEKRENQKWRRQEDFPEIWYDYRKKTKTFQAVTRYDDEGILVSLDEKDSLELQRLLRRENKRRKEGVHAMINGKCIWICGDYYYNLQWCQMKDLPEKYGRFRFVQNDLLIVYNWAKVVAWIFGLIVAKCKKSGVTQIFAGAYLNEATLNEGWEMGLASKEYDHAVDVAMAYFFHAFDNLPEIMKPKVKKRNEHEIFFGNPVQDVRSTRVSKKGGAVLNSRVFAAKTKASCFDGPVMRRAWADEFPKWWEASHVSPEIAFMKQSETVKLQQKKNGLLLYTSYMPEVVDRGFLEYREIFKNSSIFKRTNDEGPTPSGLISFFMSGVDSNEDSFDEFGYCNKEKALMIINAENDSKKDRDSKLAHRKQYPRDKSDAFESGGTGTTFDNMRLAECNRELTAEIDSGVLPYKLGRVRWKNSVWEADPSKRPKGVFGPVYYDELTENDRLYPVEGKEPILKIFGELREELLNRVVLKNNRSIDNGDLAPLDDCIGAAAFDPTDYKLKKDVIQGSNNAAHGGYLDDPALDTMGISSDDLLFEYFFRHDNPDDTLEDLIKLIIFLGFYWIIEANKGWVVTKLKGEGLHNFLLLRQADGSIKPYREGDENKLINTTADSIEAYCRAINRYWAKPRAGQKDRMKSSKSPDLYFQAMQFDPNDTKRYDLVVSFGYWRLAVEAFSVYLWEKKQNGDYDGGAMRQIAEDLLD